MLKQFEDEENPGKQHSEEAVEKFLTEAMADEHHDHVEIKCWQYIVFPVWIWKTFIHAKHEAFRFKYDSMSLKAVE